MNILVIVHIKDTFVGGSKVSSIDTANGLSERNNNVYFIGDKDNIVVKNLLNEKVEIIDFKVNKYWYLKLPYYIFRIVKKYEIDTIVTFDRQSAYLSTWASFFMKKTLLPIIPGGGKDQLPIEPLKTSTIVFSSENKEDLITLFKWDERLIKVLPSRINVDRYKSFQELKNRPHKIAFISRISKSKRTSFSSFCETLKDDLLVGINSYTIDIIGDGDDLEEWHKIASKLPIKVNFIGGKKINGEILSNYRIIFGQGRVALESICSKTPTVICGSEGFKEVILKSNFNMYSKTNFTGRNIEKLKYYSSISEMIEKAEPDLLFLAKQVQEEYSIQMLLEFIEQKQNLVNFKSIISSIKNITQVKFNKKWD